MKVGDRVFHRNLGEWGTITQSGLNYAGDSTTQVVLFDSDNPDVVGEVREVSNHFLEPLIPDTREMFTNPGDCPVAPNVPVDIMFPNGKIVDYGVAGDWYWGIVPGDPSNIVSYRLR